MENSAIRKCTALYQDVDHAQEVHDIDPDWTRGVTWLVTIFGGGTGGRSPPEGGDPRACARGGEAVPPPGAARAARGPPLTVFWRLFSKKRKEVGHFVKQNGGRDVHTRDESHVGAYFRV